MSSNQRNQQPYPPSGYGHEQYQQPPSQPYYQSVISPPLGYQQVPSQSQYGYQASPPQTYPYQPRPASYQHPPQPQYYQRPPSPQPPIYYPQTPNVRHPSPQPAGPLILILRGHEKHIDKITPAYGNGPSYTVTYNRHTFTSQPVISIQGSHGLTATCDYHSFSSKVDVVLDGRPFTYKDSFESAHGAGPLFWKLEGSARTGILRLDDRTGQCICTFGLGYTGNEGKIEIWKQGLGQGLLDEIVVTLLAEQESIRRQLADKANSNAGLYGALGAQAAGF